MPKTRFTIEELKTLASSQNIAEFLECEELEQIGNDIVSDFEDDYGDMSDKIEKWDEILDVARQIKEEKNFPWPGASNMKYPIIAAASIRFAARMYPEIVKAGRIARVKVNGADPEGTKEERGIRVEKHLNYQLSEEIKNWESDTDILLSLIPIYGCYYKKVYFSQIENKPVVDICSPKDIVCSGKTNSLEEDKRITHILPPMTENEVIERIRAGLFLNIDIPKGENDDNDECQDEEFIEQHCYLDLDEDGYKEPYIVTAHKESKQVFRIVARFTEDDVDSVTIDGEEVISKIRAFTHFVKYIFLPAFDGSTTGLGMGELLIPLNEQINSLINQLTDAGTLANVQGGFIGRGVRMDGGPFRLSMGEWIPVESRGGSLRDNIFPLPANEPSQALFALLGMMVDVAEGLSASKDVAPGEIPANTPATTTLAVIEEGLKVYSSIHKRIYVSIKEELRKIYRLNKQYGDPDKYLRYHDEDVDMFEDYEFEDEDISPVASPEVSSDMQRLVRAQGLVAMLDSPGAMQGGLDPRAIMRNYLEATHQDNIDELQPPPAPVQEGPSLEEQMLQMQAQIEQGKLALKEYELQIKEQSEYIKGIKALAEAEAAEEGKQLEQYQSGVQNIKDMLEIEERQETLNQQRVATQQQMSVPNETV